MIDFEIPAEELRQRVRDFIDLVAIPAEERDLGEHGLTPDLRAELQAEAKRAGVLAPQLPIELGGHGLDMRGVAVILEEAGRGLLGPAAMNCAAPDEGNMQVTPVSGRHRISACASKTLPWRTKLRHYR